MKLTINLEPVPLARPRVNTTNRGRYLPKRSVTFRQNFQLMLRAAFHGSPFENPLSVTVHFYKNVNPAAQTFGDIDNLAKAVLDACNGVLWTDDKLITELHCYKHKGTPKIELEVIGNVD